MKVKDVHPSWCSKIILLLGICLLAIAGMQDVFAEVDRSVSPRTEWRKDYLKIDVSKVVGNPGANLDKKVLLLGSTDSMTMQDKARAEFFCLIDPAGKKIEVRTNMGLPPAKAVTVWVYGVVTAYPEGMKPEWAKDDDDQEVYVYVSEVGRVIVPTECLEKANVFLDEIPRPDDTEAWEKFLKPDPEETTRKVKNPGNDVVVDTQKDAPTLWIIFAAVFGGLILLLIVIKLLFGRRPVSQGTSFGKGGLPIPNQNVSTPSPMPMAVPPEDSTQLKMAPEGGTVKLNLGTQKLLPGHFEIISGSNQSERIPLCAQRTMIARAVGNRPKGNSVIELEGQGISSKQAEVVYDGRAWKLINLADPISKNATMFDGREMGFNEQVDIVEGSQIRICDYQLIFHPVQSYKG